MRIVKCYCGTHLCENPGKFLPLIGQFATPAQGYMVWVMIPPLMIISWHYSSSRVGLWVLPRILFSLKANSWKKKSEICKYQPGNHQTGQAAVVNGALHWVMQERSVHSVTCHNKVVYFDLADEKWKDMLLPDLDTGRRRLTFHLGVLGGCLCVLGVDRTSVNRSAFVWVMKEYGVMESWTNVINFSYNEPSHRIAPFCFTKDDVIVLEIGGENKLLVVNCERNTIRSVPVRTGYAMPYTTVESLVSVYGGNGSLKRCLKRKK
ncbi:hypothetical protein LguiA_031851 [Lonicera macranthoides]